MKLVDRRSLFLCEICNFAEWMDVQVLVLRFFTSEVFGLFHGADQLQEVKQPIIHVCSS